MELSFIHFFIVCPLVFLGGFVDAVAGGGGLISLPAYLIAGVPPHMSIATNKLSSAMGTTLTTVRFAKKGFIPWKQAAVCVVFAFVGSSLGAKLALKIDARIFTMMMLVILPLVALYVLKGKSLGQGGNLPVSPAKTLAISSLAALGIGCYDGFYGPGTGTFLLLALTGLAHMELTKANGVTKAINLTTNLAALFVFLMEGKVVLVLGLVAGCFGILGNYLGSKTFIQGGVKFTRPLILVVLTIFFIRVIWQLATGQI
ncbi:MAG: TSUP family transporter [Ruminiclostridium sp.]|nr:TSUP family transporter [Ruminiclostridium sp.]